MGLEDDVAAVQASDLARQQEAEAVEAAGHRAMARWHQELADLWAEVEVYCRHRGLPLPTFEDSEPVVGRSLFGRPKVTKIARSRLGVSAGLSGAYLVPGGELVRWDGQSWVPVVPVARYGMVVEEWRYPGGQELDRPWTCDPDGPIVASWQQDSPYSLRQAVADALTRL